MLAIEDALFCVSRIPFVGHSGKSTRLMSGERHSIEAHLGPISTGTQASLRLTYGEICLDHVASVFHSLGDARPRKDRCRIQLLFTLLAHWEEHEVQGQVMLNPSANLPRCGIAAAQQRGGMAGRLLRMDR